MHAPSIATEDMLVYKLLIWHSLDQCYCTPYRFMEMKLEETYSAEISYMSMYRSVVTGLHAFTDFKQAMARAKSSVLFDRVIANAIIPKGAKYHHGTQGEIVSTKLKVIRYNV